MRTRAARHLSLLLVVHWQLVLSPILRYDCSCMQQASRAVFKEINTRFPALPFTFRELEGNSSREASSSRLGIVECLSHGLLHPYPVMYEKSGELVAQFKTTVLLMPNGSDR